MHNEITVKAAVVKQAQEALELAALMLDGENQPPQFTSGEALKIVKAAHQALSIDAEKSTSMPSSYML